MLQWRLQRGQDNSGGAMVQERRAMHPCPTTLVSSNLAPLTQKLAARRQASHDHA